MQTRDQKRRARFAFRILNFALAGSRCSVPV